MKSYKRISLGPTITNYIRTRDGGICVYCKDALGQEIDHVIPIHHGGPNIRGNLVLACKNCNLKKKGNLHELMIAQAFIYLAQVGESLDWVDKIFIGEPLPSQSRSPQKPLDED